MSTDINPTTRCGYVAIVGRPNVGKSTLMNHLLGQKISITSRKPQTTRHSIVGILTEVETQVIFVDTPGIHQNAAKAINQYMNRSALQALQDVDLVLFVVDRTHWTAEDDLVLQHLERVKVPVALVLNKVDQIDDKSSLLPRIQTLSERREFAAIFAISALKGQKVDDLKHYLLDNMPSNDFFFPEDQITDRSERFLAAEIVREKLMRNLGEELPYELTVEIEDFGFQDHVLHIHALILVEREGQKKIVIGEKGEKLKRIGTDARKDLELLLDTKVMLNLWVKVKSGWSDDERALRSLGYRD
ncbi:GTPase Era [Salinispirillum marinum]|uniref:GTPase Era n=2 Tax=Saccharospirillaceae TaxID=255527 RepID=A0ABV8BGC0_9GAMM